MLNIFFHVLIGYLYIFTGEMPVQVLAHFSVWCSPTWAVLATLCRYLNQVSLLLLSCRHSYILWILDPYQLWFANIFFQHSVGLSFHFLDNVFGTKVLNVEVQFIYSLLLTLWCQMNISSHSSRSWRFTPVFTSKSFMV